MLSLLLLLLIFLFLELPSFLFFKPGKALLHLYAAKLRGLPEREQPT